MEVACLLHIFLGCSLYYEMGVSWRVWIRGVRKKMRGGDEKESNQLEVRLLSDLCIIDLSVWLLSLSLPPCCTHSFLAYRMVNCGNSQLFWVVNKRNVREGQEEQKSALFNCILGYMQEYRPMSDKKWNGQWPRPKWTDEEEGAREINKMKEHNEVQRKIAVHNQCQTPTARPGSGYTKPIPPALRNSKNRSNPCRSHGYKQ